LELSSRLILLRENATFFVFSWTMFLVLPHTNTSGRLMACYTVKLRKGGV
jgi:hypothetical protein